MTRIGSTSRGGFKESLKKIAMNEIFKSSKSGFKDVSRGIQPFVQRVKEVGSKIFIGADMGVCPYKLLYVFLRITLYNGNNFYHLTIKRGIETDSKAQGLTTINNW